MSADDDDVVEPEPVDPPVELGASFRDSETAAAAWGAVPPEDVQVTAPPNAQRTIPGRQAEPWPLGDNPHGHQVAGIVRVQDHTGSPDPMRPEDQLPPFRPPVRDDPRGVAQVPDLPDGTRTPTAGEERTLRVTSTGDAGIDAMLMCRSVFESLPDYEQRRLLNYLADRYGAFGR